MKSSLLFNEAPNHALQRTAPRVTVAAIHVRCLFLRSTFAATAPRSAVAELGVVSRFSHSFQLSKQQHPQLTIMKTPILAIIASSLLSTAAPVWSAELLTNGTFGVFRF